MIDVSSCVDGYAEEEEDDLHGREGVSAEILDRAAATPAVTAGTWAGS